MDERQGEDQPDIPVNPYKKRFDTLTRTARRPGHHGPRVRAQQGGQTPVPV